MTTGKPTRLSEKLNAELDLIRQDHAALMASQLTSFERDLNSIARNAKHTIETDIQDFLRTTQNMFARQTRNLRRWLTISPWLIAGLMALTLALMMGLSWFWTGRLATSELTRLGLSRIDQTNGTWLILNPDKTALKTCTVVSRTFTCIEIKEN